MSSIVISSPTLKLGPDDQVDLLPRKDDEPNVFVASHFKYLSGAFQQHFPLTGHVSMDTHPKVDKGIKRYRENEGESDKQVECELVFSRVDGEQVLGLLQRGTEPIFYDTLAIVAIITSDTPLKDVKSDSAAQQDKSYEDIIIDSACKQRGGERASSGKAYTGIVLGHIVLKIMQDTDHPINFLDKSLLRNGWINFSKAYVTLQTPYLPPAEEVFGPTSRHAIGRAALSPTVELGGDRVWRDSVTKTVWNTCPHRLMPAPELFGTVQFQIKITEDALNYGTAEDHDGFVDAVTVARRDLTLASRLKNLVWASIDSEEGFLSIISEEDDFWSRTPNRYYDEDSKPLILDNRIETALESTRPAPTSPMQEPSSTINTTLLPFQRKALAWMMSKEVKVVDDEGALLPHWIALKGNPGFSGIDETSRDNKRHKGMLLKGNVFYMDTFTGTLSRQRLICRQSEPGGCLCDDMGLGKSLTTLSLIETHQRTSEYNDQSRTAQMTAKMSSEVKPFISQSTLLVVPASLIHQWYSEINKHLNVEADEDKNEYVLRYKRDITIPWTANDDRQSIRSQAKAKFTGKKQARIVLATYEDLSKELHISKRSKKAISPLLDIHWWRVMLDEAQLVSTSNGSAAEMVNCLWRTNGWIVTSTPFNSSIRDMHGLLTFLDSDFASKRLFEEFIALPFLAGDLTGIERAQSLLKRIMWRHRKEHVESELGLPPSTMQTLLLEKKGLEKTLYDREYKSMLKVVQSAVGLGRGLSKKQQDTLISLRKLISHPQLASSLGYGGPGSQRSTFANLFADLIFRNQGELYNVQMEYVVLILKIATGKKFRKEEEDPNMWKGGVCKIARVKEKLLKAREYARQAEARDVVSRKSVVARNPTPETQEAPQETMQKTEVQTKLIKTEEEIESDQKRENTEGGETKKKELQKILAPITMRSDEALYWIDVLLHPKADMSGTDVIFDPERLMNIFFEKKIIEASNVDLEDPRYHPIVLDAGDDEEEEQQGETSSNANTSEAVLLKNRFRGTSKRSIQKVWHYHPKRKLQALCRDVPGVEERIARLEGEGAYLENRIRDELGEERARLVLKEGFDALHAGNGEKQSDKSNLCPLCIEQVEVPGILPCLHTACFACLLDCINKIGQGGKTPCPMCRKPFERTDIIEVLPTINESDHMNEFGVKISGVILHIRSQLQLNPDLKIVIFSAWSTHLRFLTEALNNLDEPILSVAFSGKNQSTSLKEFQNNDQIRIILVPMKMAEGAAGLTLNIASVAYLLEPCLDSALENQALGRLNRIGQKAEKTVYFRVLAGNTIEPALVQIAENRSKDLKDKDAETRHHDTLSVDELGIAFGLDVKEEKAKRKIDLLQSRAMRMRAQVDEAEQNQEQNQEQEQEEAEEDVELGDELMQDV